MVTPYLNRNEAILLTTHNVNFNSIVAELILTNQRLIIFDSLHPQFRYQTLPLASIETVMVTEDAQSNPVMYLSVTSTTPDTAPQSKEFTFLRQTGGDRRQECDVWIKQLKMQIASVREQRLRTVQPSPPEDTDLIFDEPKTPFPEPVTGEPAPQEIPPEPVESAVSPPPPLSAEDTVRETESQGPAPETPVSDEQVPQTDAGDAQKELLSSRSDQTPASGKSKALAIGAIVIVFIALAVMAFLYSTMPGEPPATPVTPVITPALTTAATTIATPAVQQTPSPKITQVTTVVPVKMIPEKGIWVRIDYAGNYTGRIGSSGDLKQVNASGEQYYQLAITEGIVEATIQKQDGSGKALTIEVYQNGRMMARSTKTTPLATIDLRVELKKV